MPPVVELAPAAASFPGCVQLVKALIPGHQASGWIILLVQPVFRPLQPTPASGAHGNEAVSGWDAVDGFEVRHLSHESRKGTPTRASRIRYTVLPHGGLGACTLARESLSSLMATLTP